MSFQEVISHWDDSDNAMWWGRKTKSRKSFEKGGHKRSRKVSIISDEKGFVRGYVEERKRSERRRNRARWRVWNRVGVNNAYNLTKKSG